MKIRLLRIDRDDVLMPMYRDLGALMWARDEAARAHGFNSPEFNDACEKVREKVRENLYNNQQPILAALSELIDLTSPEIER